MPAAAVLGDSEALILTARVVQTPHKQEVQDVFAFPSSPPRRALAIAWLVCPSSSPHSHPDPHESCYYAAPPPPAEGRTLLWDARCRMAILDVQKRLFCAFTTACTLQRRCKRAHPSSNDALRARSLFLCVATPAPRARSPMTWPRSADDPRAFSSPFAVVASCPRRSQRWGRTSRDASSVLTEVLRIAECYHPRVAWSFRRAEDGFRAGLGRRPPMTWPRSTDESARPWILVVLSGGIDGRAAPPSWPFPPTGSPLDSLSRKVRVARSAVHARTLYRTFPPPPDRPFLTGGPRPLLLPPLCRPFTHIARVRGVPPAPGWSWRRAERFDGGLTVLRAYVSPTPFHAAATATTHTVSRRRPHLCRCPTLFSHDSARFILLRSVACAMDVDGRAGIRSWITEGRRMQREDRGQTWHGCGGRGPAPIDVFLKARPQCTSGLTFASLQPLAPLQSRPIPAHVRPRVSIPPGIPPRLRPGPFSVGFCAVQRRRRLGCRWSVRAGAMTQHRAEMEGSSRNGRAACADGGGAEARTLATTRTRDENRAVTEMVRSGRLCSFCLCTSAHAWIWMRRSPQLPSPTLYRYARPLSMCHALPFHAPTEPPPTHAPYPPCTTHASRRFLSPTWRVAPSFHARRAFLSTEKAPRVLRVLAPLPQTLPVSPEDAMFQPGPASVSPTYLVRGERPSSPLY
ncbi:hypothetical protein DFH09DRAFT_1399713 [Mycena vulgaris]|nr:hypothetical protein DFH09DRAFT_1399713 [Mycena vulgaris]